MPQAHAHHTRLTHSRRLFTMHCNQKHGRRQWCDGNSTRMAVDTRSFSARSPSPYPEVQQVLAELGCKHSGFHRGLRDDRATGHDDGANKRCERAIAKACRHSRQGRKRARFWPHRRVTRTVNTITSHSPERTVALPAVRTDKANSDNIALSIAPAPTPAIR